MKERPLCYHLWHPTPCSECLPGDDCHFLPRLLHVRTQACCLCRRRSVTWIGYSEIPLPCLGLVKTASEFVLVRSPSCTLSFSEGFALCIEFHNAAVTVARPTVDSHARLCVCRAHFWKQNWWMPKGRVRNVRVATTKWSSQKLLRLLLKQVPLNSKVAHLLKNM